MPMNDDPEPALPRLLCNEADNTKLHRLSRILKTGLLTLMALAVGGATLLLADPRARIAAITAPHVDVPAPSSDHDQAAPPAQSAVETQTALSAETAAPSNPQPAAVAPEPAAPEPAAPKQADAGADHDALFRQFEAWARQQDGTPNQQQGSEPANPAPTTRDLSEQSTPPRAGAAPSIPAQAETETATQGSHTAVRAAQKRRAVRELRTARAEAEAAQRARGQALHARDVPARPQAAEETPAPSAPVQSAPTPSLMQLLGLQH